MLRGLEVQRSCCLKNGLRAFLGPQERSKSGQERPKSGQERPKRGQERPRAAQERSEGDDVG